MSTEAMLKTIAAPLLMLAGLGCNAQEVRMACLFDHPPAVPTMDPEASDLSYQFQATNLERVIVLDMSPSPRVVNKDILFRLFPGGPSRVEIKNDEVWVAWRADDHHRKPLMTFSVNRFSLEALEYFQISTINGRASYSWTRRGKCKIDERKF